MSQKLDSLSKILLATGAINYMAASIDSVNEQIKMMKPTYKKAVPDLDFDEVHGEGIKARDELLAEVVADLAPILEKMGNLINGQDAICAIDEYITAPAFNVILHGHDDTEGDFDNL
jgi:hypothetical protein